MLHPTLPHLPPLHPHRMGRRHQRLQPPPRILLLPLLPAPTARNPPTIPPSNNLPRHQQPPSRALPLRIHLHIHTRRLRTRHHQQTQQHPHPTLTRPATRGGATVEHRKVLHGEQEPASEGSIHVSQSHREGRARKDKELPLCCPAARDAVHEPADDVYRPQLYVPPLLCRRGERAG